MIKQPRFWGLGLEVQEQGHFSPPTSSRPLDSARRMLIINIFYSLVSNAFER